MVGGGGVVFGLEMSSLSAIDGWGDLGFPGLVVVAG